MNSSFARVRPPASRADYDALRRLAWDYRAELAALSPEHTELVETFYPEPKYRAVLAEFETLHAPPAGAAVLGFDGARAVGCGMMQLLPSGDAELKRIYIAPAARGTGLGRDICTALIADCRARGHARVLLDTSRALTAAQALYESLGFVERGPYQPIPDHALPKIMFYELAL